MDQFTWLSGRKILARSSREKPLLTTYRHLLTNWHNRENACTRCKSRQIKPPEIAQILVSPFLSFSSSPPSLSFSLLKVFHRVRHLQPGKIARREKLCGTLRASISPNCSARSVQSRRCEIQFSARLSKRTASLFRDYYYVSRLLLSRPKLLQRAAPAPGASITRNHPRASSPPERALSVSRALIPYWDQFQPHRDYSLSFAAAALCCDRYTHSRLDSFAGKTTPGSPFIARKIWATPLSLGRAKIAGTSFLLSLLVRNRQKLIVHRSACTSR